MSDLTYEQKVQNFFKRQKMYEDLGWVHSEKLITAAETVPACFKYKNRYTKFSQQIFDWSDNEFKSDFDKWKVFIARETILYEMGFKYYAKTATKEAVFSYYGVLQVPANLVFSQAESSFKITIDMFKNKTKEYDPIANFVKNTIVKILEGPEKFKREQLIEIIKDI